MKLKPILLFITFLLLSEWAMALTLGQALEKAKQHAIVRNIELDVELGRQDYLGSLLNWAPSLSIERNWLQESGSSSSLSVPNDAFSINARLNLFNGMGDYGYSRSQYYQKKAEEARGQQQWRSVQFTVAELFFQCVSAQNLLEKANRAVKIRKDLEDIAYNRYQRGSLARNEYIKLKIDRNIEENNLRQREHQLRACKNSLAYWVGSEEVSSIDDPGLISKFEAQLGKNYSLESHPDWQVLKNENESTRWSIWNEGSALLPDLSLSYSLEPAASFQTEEKILMLTASWELLNGAGWTEYKKSRINFLKTQNQLNEFKMLWTEKNETARSQLLEQITTYKTNVENSQYAEEILKTGLRRFRYGSISSNEVAIDQSRLIDALRAEWQSWFALHQSWLELLSARGEDVYSYLNSNLSDQK
ncbi:MAG: TolC family protein [Bdellovibrionales bacterium]